MAVERRVVDDRRHRERRLRASEHVDVTRGEHENLYGQVVANTQLLRQVEADVQALRQDVLALRDLIAKKLVIPLGNQRLMDE